MKTKILKVLALSGLLMFGFAACNENKERPVDPVVHDGVNKIEVNTVDNDKEWESFKVDAEARIDENDRKIKDLEERNSAKKETEEYSVRIADMKDRNSKLRAKVRDYKNDGKRNWEEFKKEFNHDMDELGKALENFGTNNKK